MRKTFSCFSGFDPLHIETYKNYGWRMKQFYFYSAQNTILFVFGAHAHIKYLTVDVFCLESDESRKILASNANFERVFAIIERLGHIHYRENRKTN